MPCFYGEDVEKGKAVATEIISLMECANANKTKYQNLIKEINGGHIQMSVEEEDLKIENPFFQDYLKFNLGSSRRHDSTKLRRIELLKDIQMKIPVLFPPPPPMPKQKSMKRCAPHGWTHSPPPNQHSNVDVVKARSVDAVKILPNQPTRRLLHLPSPS